MTDSDAALAYLQREMGEGWQCEVSRSVTGDWRGWAFMGGVSVLRLRPDPMSAARACVEAWREVTATLRREADSHVGAVSHDRDNIRRMWQAERDHADRLAEALQNVFTSRAWLADEPENASALEALAAHAARRAGR